MPSVSVNEDSSTLSTRNSTSGAHYESGDYRPIDATRRLKGCGAGHHNDEAGELTRRPAHPLVMSSGCLRAAIRSGAYQPPMRSSMTGTVRAMMRMSSASDCRRM